ncbi:hypothetical protein [Shewanella sp.]|uniref:hypothetical protein n=1 Tax=Shewanella sp. TaxID=50422 RepID=UPI0025D52248|nr:hypothetical protein [Shewanella sp.]
MSTRCDHHSAGKYRQAVAKRRGPDRCNYTALNGELTASDTVVIRGAETLQDGQLVKQQAIPGTKVATAS